MRIEPSDSVVLTVTASAVVSARPCVLQGLVLTPAAAACTVQLFDPAPFIEGTTPTTTNATLKISFAAPANASSVCLPASASGISFNNGCVAVVTGAGATSTVITGEF